MSRYRHGQRRDTLAPPKPVVHDFNECWLSARMPIYRELDLPRNHVAFFFEPVVALVSICHEFDQPFFKGVNRLLGQKPQATLASLDFPAFQN